MQLLPLLKQRFERQGFMGRFALRLQRCSRSFSRRIAAGGYLAENFLDSGPRRRERDCRTRAERDASLLPFEGVLRQIALASAC
jgi:hypothetical protein